MQMGLSNRSENNRYLNIFDGTFRLSVPEGTEGAVTRVNKRGDTVHELVYKNIAGWIKNIYIKKSDFGRRVNIIVSDGQLNYFIQLGYADYLATAIYKMLPNVDPEQPVRISLAKKKGDDGKEKTSIFMAQEEGGAEVPIKHYYNKENPQGIPDFEEIMVKGQPTKDNTKQVQWLIENSVKPFLAKLGVEDTIDEDAGADVDNGEASPLDDPFKDGTIPM